MTNAKLIQTIKAEIERLKDENRKIKCQANERYCSGYDDAFYDLVPFLSTLEESEKSSEGLEEEIRSYLMTNRIVNHSEMGWKRWGEQIARHFAQWGAEHTPLPEDTVLFNKGVEEGKRLMMEDAVEGFIFQAEDYYPKELIARYDGELKHGDKVRIIIVKEDEK